MPTSPSATYGVGDEVQVVLKASMGFKAVWLAYFLPLVVLLAVALGLIVLGVSEVAAGLAGLGAVAWTFYKKWAQANPQAAGQKTSPTTLTDTVNDPTLLLLLRAMVFAARADGHIDETERARMQDMLNQLYPGQDVTPLMEQLVQEKIDPSLLARQVESPEQAEDVYRLSCLIVDVDHFMERSYLDNLAQVLGLAKETKIALEQEAAAAKRQMASL